MAKSVTFIGSDNYAWRNRGYEKHNIDNSALRFHRIELFVIEESVQRVQAQLHHQLFV